MENGPTGEQTCEPIMVVEINNPAIIRTLLRIFPVELKQCLFQTFQQFIANVPDDEHGIWGVARLAGINPSPEGNAAGCYFQVGGRVDDAGILSAEFQNYRSQ